MLSAFLDNVTTVLLMFPMTLLLADILDEDPVPFLLLEVIASNIGGTATLVGDPPNIIIGTATGLSFNSFIVNLGPPVVVVLVVTLAIVWFVWGRKMRPLEENQREIFALDPASSILVVAGMTERHGLKISFVRFMLVGLPLTVIAIAISTAYVLLFLVQEEPASYA